MENKFLPLGTVVKLVNGKKNVMITGFCPVSKEKGQKYDYCGCIYPEGFISSDFTLLFNNNQIDNILFKGYVNDEEVSFKEKLVQFVENYNNNGNLGDSNHFENINEIKDLNMPQMFNADIN